MIQGFFRRGGQIIPIIKKKIKSSSMGQYGRAYKKSRSLKKDIFEIKMDDFKTRLQYGQKNVTRSTELSIKQKKLKKLNKFKDRARGPAFKQAFASGLLGGTTGTVTLIATGSLFSPAAIPVAAGAGVTAGAYKLGKKKYKDK